MSAQLVVLVHRCQRRAYVTGAVPVHVPVVELSVAPTVVVPLTAGGTVFDGPVGLATLIVTAALVSERPPVSVTSTRAGNVPPLGYEAVGVAPVASPNEPLPSVSHEQVSASPSGSVELVASRWTPSG